MKVYTGYAALNNSSIYNNDLIRFAISPYANDPLQYSMIIPSNFYATDSEWALAAALYLDAYIDVDTTSVCLPKRTLNGVRDPKRLPHFTWWTPYMHSKYLRLPDSLPITQYVILDDGWAERTFELVRTTFPAAKDRAMRVALYMWYNVLFWASFKPGQGFVTTHERTAELCGCSVAFVIKVVTAMIEAGLIYRKWVGNGAGHFGTCYMAGRPNNVDRLLELAEKPI